MAGGWPLLGLLLALASPILGNIESISSTKVDLLNEEEKDFFVISYTHNCKTCDRFMELVLENLQLLDPGYLIYKSNDKKLIKSLNIRNFPALTKFHQGKAEAYQKSMEDATTIVDFMTEDSAAEEDQIELVSGEELEEIIACENLVAVIFDTKDTNKNEIDGMKDIMEEFDVRVVLAKEFKLVAKYKITDLPGLALFRNKKKIIYKGKRSKEELIKWIVANKKLPEEVKETVENIENIVEADTLESVLNNLEDVFVQFYDDETPPLSDEVMEYINRRKANFFRSRSEDAICDLSPEYTAGTFVFFSNSQAFMFDEDDITDQGIRLWISKMLNRNPQNRWIVQVINEYKAFMIAFCKYTAYSSIALIHTCFLLKNIYNSKSNFSMFSKVGESAAVD